MCRPFSIHHGLWAWTWTLHTPCSLGKIGHNSLDVFESAVKSDNFVDECGSIAKIGISVVLSNSPSDSDVIAKLRYLLDRIIHYARIIENLDISKSC